MVNQSTLQPLLVQERVIKAVRAFFDEARFHEVISPVLQSAVPTEPTIYPFTTTWQTREGDQQLSLATSPESYLKKLLAAGLGNCYAIGHSFRNLESTGARHHPEFLMLEWYRANARDEQIMADLEQLLVYVIAKVRTAGGSNPQHAHTNPHNKIDSSDAHAIIYQGKRLAIQPPFPRLSLDKLFAKYVGVSIDQILTDEKVTALAQARGYNTQDATWEQLFNQIFLNEIEPTFDDQPFFLTDFPAKLSPLCQPQVNRPHLAQRFEFFLGGLELANGNTEATDAEAVAQTFRNEAQQRRQRNDPATTLDTDFITALRKLQSRSYAGIGLGVQRLAMILADLTDIHQLTPVPTIISR